MNELGVRDGTKERYIFYVVLITLPLSILYNICCGKEEDDEDTFKKQKEDWTLVYIIIYILYINIISN